MDQTHLPLPNRRQGKVRDIYDLPAQAGKPPRMLIAASDRLSAYDVVMPTPFPGKGVLLTQISARWFQWMSRDTGFDFNHHLISTDDRALPDTVSGNTRKSLAGRIMICRKAEVIPVECVARGYLAGSGWKEYLENGAVCGIRLPHGLKQCDRLAQPIFTPATKAQAGHDENIAFERACEIVSEEIMQELRRRTIALYRKAHEYALERGIIIADTKFEFGFALDAGGEPTDEILLIDEILTPDSSRFWPLAQYEPGRDQVSYDKQYLRNYLETLVAQGSWAKAPPGPAIPPEVVENTMKKYREALRLLFGQEALETCNRFLSR